MSDKDHLSKHDETLSLGNDTTVISAPMSSAQPNVPHVRDGIEEEMLPTSDIRRDPESEEIREVDGSVVVHIYYEETPANTLHNELQQPQLSSNVNLIPVAEVSQALGEDDIENAVPRAPTDYEIFLAKSRADYERNSQAEYANQIDHESLVNKGSVSQNDSRHLASFRTFLRTAQIFIRFFIICEV